MLLQGVQYKADLDLQNVLSPHLISFGVGCQLILKEVVEYAKKGWYPIHVFLPFLSMQNIPRSSTPRPAVDGGAPRNPVADSAGTPVIRLNVASNGDTGSQKWTPKIRPREREMIVSIAPFRYLAFHTREQVLIMTDDEKVCFNQVSTC